MRSPNGSWLLTQDIEKDSALNLVPQRPGPLETHDEPGPGSPAHDTAQLTEAFRRAVLRLFVRRGLFEREDAEAMLAWPHSGFHVHDAVLVPDGDMAFALRLARYRARNPAALERLEYLASAREVRYRSDKTDGPTAGTETVDPLEFLARLTAHIPNKHQVMTRYYGYYANRVRGARRRREPPVGEPTLVTEPVPLTFREARRRWAELLRHIFEVDPLRCPACGSEMRIVAFITQRAVIDRILDHVRRPRERPWAAAGSTPRTVTSAAPARLTLNPTRDPFVAAPRGGRQRGTAVLRGRAAVGRARGRVRPRESAHSLPSSPPPFFANTSRLGGLPPRGPPLIHPRCVSRSPQVSRTE